MNPTELLRVAVLVSGGGTNLQAMLDRSRAGKLKAEIVAVVSDNPEAFGLTRARQAGVPCHTVRYGAVETGGPTTDPLPSDLDWAAFLRRRRILTSGDSAKVPEQIVRLRRMVRAEREIIRKLAAYRPDYVCLAGYMRLLSPYFLDHFNRDGGYRVVNIHPALLPAFPGQHGYRDTFDHGCKWGGVTVHYVDEGEDSGPVIAQAVYPIWPEDDPDAVRRRGLALEYEVYSQVLNWLAAGQVAINRPAGARPRVVITDPAYRRIMTRWLDLAMTG